MDILSVVLFFGGVVVIFLGIASGTVGVILTGFVCTMIGGLMAH